MARRVEGRLTRGGLGLAAQLIHVVRHAHAADRGAWSHGDHLRPLSDRGCGQAERLVGHLGVTPATILSSPSVRCLATVLPLALAHGLPVATLTELAEGSAASPLLERLAAVPVSPVVVCTHGDILAGLLGLLISAGVVLPSTRAEKGSTWTIEVVDGRLCSATYLPPP